MNNLKKCSICKIPKPPEAFGKCSKRKSGLRSYCKKCGNERKSKLYYNPEKYRANRIYQTYGITSEQYNTLFIGQGGRCSICGKHQSELNHRLNIDHDHKIGVIRGLLCNDCNRGIGFFKDNPNSLLNAFNYLKRSLK